MVEIEERREKINWKNGGNDSYRTAAAAWSEGGGCKSAGGRDVSSPQ
jgi:hypothetical protein